MGLFEQFARLDTSATGIKTDNAQQKSQPLGGWLLKEKLVRLAGIEPTTLGFGGQYSIH